MKLCVLSILSGENVSEADKIKRATNLLAIGKLARRNPTVSKQIDAGNSEEQIMPGGDLHQSVQTAVLEMLANSSDKDDAPHLQKDPEAMASYARLVFKMLASDISKEDMLGLS